MLSFKGMRFPADVILLCIRWYATYPLSYRHIEEMLGEREMSLDHSTINRSVRKVRRYWLGSSIRGSGRGASPGSHTGPSITTSRAC
jgi:hypothetical protein